MARWDIQPSGVRAVLLRTETHAKDLGNAGQAIGKDLQACGTALGQSLVAVALSDFATKRAPELSAAATRIRSAMGGTVSAVNAYMQGEREMALRAQAAATAPTTKG